MSSAANQLLPSDTIVRVLFTCSKAHVYAVPPLTSNKGYMAAQWTTRPEIFTARVRITETATSSPASKSQAEALAVAVVLEDPASGELFAAAPYTHPSTVTPCMDSSRFFALRVVGDGGMKATLGVGFEERGDAFEFGVALQGAARVLGFAAAKESAGKSKTEQPVRDLSLKEGEMVKVDIGRRSTPNGITGGNEGVSGGSGIETAVFEIKPPPSAAEVKREKEKLGQEQEGDAQAQAKLTAQQLGFDDGEFGEFQ